MIKLFTTLTVIWLASSALAYNYFGVYTSAGYPLYVDAGVHFGFNVGDQYPGAFELRGGASVKLPAGLSAGADALYAAHVFMDDLGDARAILYVGGGTSLVYTWYDDSFVMFPHGLVSVVLPGGFFTEVQLGPVVGLNVDFLDFGFGLRGGYNFYIGLE